MADAPIPLPAGASGDDLVPVVAYVPAKDVMKMQAAIHQLVADYANTSGTYKPPFSSTYGPKDAWNLPAWQGDEYVAAAWILGALGSNQRRVLAHLIASGSDGAWTGELRKSSGYDNSTSMSGVFKAIGGRFRSVGLRPVWNGGEKDSQKGQRLTVKDTAPRTLFAKVLQEQHPTLAGEFGIQ